MIDHNKGKCDKNDFTDMCNLLQELFFFQFVNTYLILVIETLKACKTKHICNGILSQSYHVLNFL